MKPQPVLIEVRDVGERVIAASVSVAGDVADIRQTPEDAHPRPRVEDSEECLEISDAMSLEQRP